jgi:hypothetical protein
VVTDEMLRRAIFDPAVRKRRVLNHQPGLFVDRDDLVDALTGLSARNLDAGEVDTAVRRHGGYRFERHVGRAVRATLRWLTRGRWPSAARQQYWLDMYSWQKLRQRRNPRAG